MTPAGKPVPRIPLERVRSRLARVWFLGAGVSAFILVLQSILGKYGTEVQKVWSWFVPTVVPTLSLMLTVIGAAAMEGKVQEHRRVPTSFYQLALWLSVAYLVVVGLTIVLEPFSTFEGTELFTLSNYWLGPIQGLCVAAIGYIFVSKEAKT